MSRTTPSLNREETRAFLGARPCVFNLPDYVVPFGYSLVASKPIAGAEGEMQTICLISMASEPETVYEVKKVVKQTPNALLPIVNCTQLTVWRQLAGVHSHVLSNFSRKIFNFLLQSHNILISDEEQTQDGRRFWLDRISESFSISGRYVYYIDLENLDGDIAPVVEHIQSHEALMEEYLEKGWGADEAHRNKVFLISKQNLA